MSATRYERLLGLIEVLSTGDRMSIDSLAEALDLSESLIIQDINTLKQAGLSISEDSKSSTFYLEVVNSMPFQLSEDESLAVVTAGELDPTITDPSLVLTYKQALRKMRHALHLDEYEKPKEGEGDRLPIISERDKLSIIQRAITHRNVLHMRYNTHYSEESTIRDIEAQALYLTKHSWIMIAWCRLRDDYREFKLDRIDSLQLKKEIFDEREFELMKYFYNILSP